MFRGGFDDGDKMKVLAAASGLLALAAGAAVTEHKEQRVSYDGYQVLRLAIGDDAAPINEIVASLGLSTWKGTPKANALADIVVPPNAVGEFHARVAGINATLETTMHENLGASIQEENHFEVYAAGSANLSWFDSYHSYADHLQYISDLHAAYPDNSELVVSGRSLNGRPITGIHMWGAAGPNKRPAVVFHGTVHAREWISTMVTEYLAYQLLSQRGTSDEVRAFLDRNDFYVFPLVNPDGFVFTQTTDRLWRKNRQVTKGSDCVGRDINRNWAYQWDTVGGSSKEPCAQDYRGVQQADAPETEGLMGYVREVKDRQGLQLFVDFHSYAQYFMAPYGYNCERRPRNDRAMLALAAATVDAMRGVFGTNFQSGRICNMLYMSTGNSVDYVYDVIKADYSYTLELRDQGQTGFVLPPAQILPSGQETWVGIRYMLSHLK